MISKITSLLGLMMSLKIGSTMGPKMRKKTIFPGLKAMLALGVMMLAGCATSGNGPFVAAETAEAAEKLTVAAVRQQPNVHAQSEVQWGGVVNQVENREGATWIEVIERPLNSNGHPVTSSLSGGRFLAVVPGFLDPTDYRKGRAITISGNIQGIDIRPFGDTAYDYPKVSVTDHQLWVPNNRRLARRGGYYHPHLGKVSLGIGFGRRSSLGIGFGFGHKGFGRFGHRGFGHRGYGRGGFGRGRFIRRH